MKKTLALVLALLMVLALVPTAFADTITTGTNYTVTVTAEKNTGYPSVENTKHLTWEDTSKGEVPVVELALPFDAIGKAESEDLWEGDYAKVTFEVSGFKTKDFEKGATVYVNGDKAPRDAYDKDTGKVTFSMTNLTPADTTFIYDVVVTRGTSPNATTEKMSFCFKYENTTKPVYDLKFGSADTAVLKDGVYFIDSAGPTIDKNVKSDVVKIFKNDGSTFTEVAYYSQNEGSYIVPSKRNTVNNSNSTIELKLTPQEGAKTYYVNVETRYAFYQGQITFKYRANVQRVDPKGVFFAKDEYTIGVNEVLEPTYTTTVPVWHDVASIVKLNQTAYTEKGIIDCDGNTITGLREGVAYVVLTYDDKFVAVDGVGTPVHYTDTVKVTVKGTYQVTDKANYIVTTSSSNLNVRSGAGTKYSKIGSLAKGTVVEVVEIKDGWAKIIFPSANYTNGYVSAQYLTKQSTSPETVIGEKTVIARVLNVRSGAGTSYSIVGKLNRNTKVEVIETVANGSWSKIKFNGGYAYVSSTYIQ